MASTCRGERPAIAAIGSRMIGRSHPITVGVATRAESITEKMRRSPRRRRDPVGKRLPPRRFLEARQRLELPDPPAAGSQPRHEERDTPVIQSVTRTEKSVPVSIGAGSLTSVTGPGAGATARRAVTTAA